MVAMGWKWRGWGRRQWYWFVDPGNNGQYEDRDSDGAADVNKFKFMDLPFPQKNNLNPPSPYHKFRTCAITGVWFSNWRFRGASMTRLLVLGLGLAPFAKAKPLKMPQPPAANPKP